jgi:hypothetical protein
VKIVRLKQKPKQIQPNNLSHTQSNTREIRRKFWEITKTIPQESTKIITKIPPSRENKSLRLNISKRRGPSLTPSITHSQIWMRMMKKRRNNRNNNNRNKKKNNKNNKPSRLRPQKSLPNKRKKMPPINPRKLIKRSKSRKSWKNLTYLWRKTLEKFLRNNPKISNKSKRTPTRMPIRKKRKNKPQSNNSQKRAKTNPQPNKLKKQNKNLHSARSRQFRRLWKNNLRRTKTKNLLPPKNKPSNK